MKRIGAFSLAIFIFVLSVFSVIPIDVYADDNKTVLPFTFKQLNNSVGAGMSASDANAAVTAHKDIYTSDGTLLFIYNPSNSYNWTTSSKAYYLTLNYSDEQLKNILMSKNPLSTLFNVWGAALSNNNGIRAFCAGLGTIFSGNSDMGTKVLDTLSGNYNYLDALSYDEDSQTITMSNDNGSVDKLREEIKYYYYKSNGMFFIEPNTSKLGDILSSSWYSDMNLYTEDFNIANNYDYILYNTRYHFLAAFNKTDFSYGYSSGYERFQDSRSYYYDFQFVDKDLNNINLPFYYNFNIFETFSEDNNVSLTSDSVGILTLGSYNRYYSGLTSFFSNTKPCVPKERIGFYGYKFCDDIDFYDLSRYQYGESSSTFLYSKDGTPLLGFSSYDKIFDYVHGDSSAYLGSAINKVGEDISFSIKDMNENLGTKMDELIDSINSGKGNMSADELQNAIDKGLEDLNKNTEDIKDNTSSILDKLEEQNQILLQILGVTEYIAYQTTKDDGSSYTKTDLTNTINKIYNGLGNAILYGKNTLTNSGDNSGAASQSSIVTREDFKLSNNIYTSSGSGVSPGTPVVAYSLDDCSVYDDSNDYDVGIATQDINNMDIHDGLFGKFPFSVPYQLYEWLQVLQADPVAPKLVYNYGFLLGHKDDQKYDLVIDFNIYERWANVCKSFLRLSFTLAMSLFLYKKFKGNSIF